MIIDAAHSPRDMTRFHFRWTPLVEGPVRLTAHRPFHTSYSYLTPKTRGSGQRERRRYQQRYPVLINPLLPYSAHFFSLCDLRDPHTYLARFGADVHLFAMKCWWVVLVSVGSTSPSTRQATNTSTHTPATMQGFCADVHRPSMETTPTIAGTQ